MFVLQHQLSLQVVWYLIASPGLFCVFVWLLWQTRLFRDWPFQNARGQSSHRQYWAALCLRQLPPVIHPCLLTFSGQTKEMAATAWKTQGTYQPSGVKDLFSGGESDWKFDSSSCGTTKALLWQIDALGTQTHCFSPYTQKSFLSFIT